MTERKDWWQMKDFTIGPSEREAPPATAPAEGAPLTPTGEAELASLREQLAQTQTEVEALKGNVKELRKELARSTVMKEGK